MIEHPDHTGTSANPAAPWNHPDTATCIHCRRAIETECQECPTGAEVCEDETGSTTPAGMTAEPDWDERGD